MKTPTSTERRQIAVRGIVQGVGFRPFLFSLAKRYGLAGLVHNDAAGVHVEVEGPLQKLDLFLRAIQEEAPPLAVVDDITWRALPLQGASGFRIEESRSGMEHSALVSPDVATCGECLAELFDSSDRRYRYPFLNCTNCGPRFTITRSVPYDRAATTMVGFTMCSACRREYDDPSNRRFHAQPNACPQCGPQVRLLDAAGNEPDFATDDPIWRTADLMRQGAIVAVKGLGGFHLACNPFDGKAVSALRGRKVRQDKPFAVMTRDLEQARTLCHVKPEDAALLTSPARPIVLLERMENGPMVEDVAPRQKTLGVMLPYTPLHHMLLRDAGIPLVMTSGNRSDEPIAYLDAHAFEQLGHIADFFLVHNRPVHVRCDDSVLHLVRGSAYPIRRSRGYAPRPLRLAQDFGRHTLACGGELKSTFCVAKERDAFVSHHIGDLENYETLRSYQQGIDHYCRLFDVRPQVVAYDLHPEYLSTKYAQELAEGGMPAVGVQHHHAHIASCMADNERPVDERVIGVAWDGTGWGTDGTIWGGEFLEGDILEGFTRRAHLASGPLPGGSAAIRQPWRVAVAQLLALHDEAELLRLPIDVVRRAGEREVHLLVQLIRAGINSPLCSSAGRLFDAVAALLNLPGTMRTTYEGQAAIELELVAEGPAGSGYPFHMVMRDSLWAIDTGEIVAGVVEDVLRGKAVAAIASRFHRTMAEVVLEGCRQIREIGGTGKVALSGGTFQNMLLLEQTLGLLEENGFVVYCHRRVPANDGGLSLGQAVLADSMIARQNW